MMRQKMTRRELMALAGGTVVSIGLPGTFIKLMDKKSAGFVILEGHGEYSSNIPIQEARKDNVILAYEFSGNALPVAHGAPVRALVPDRYFYKSVKWLEGIKFSAVDEPGYYESGGYSNTADPWKEERYSD
jgi:DMSO/TMAO reductase YedYZ molybdopterin-dependent catalytic subunit